MYMKWMAIDSEKNVYIITHQISRLLEWHKYNWK